MAGPAPASIYVLAWSDGDISPGTELVLIPYGQGCMRIVSPHELAIGYV